MNDLTDTNETHEIYDGTIWVLTPLYMPHRVMPPRASLTHIWTSDNGVIWVLISALHAS